MIYVQRASCPAEALTVAPEIGSQADAPISFGSINIPEDIVNMEVEPEGVDMNQEVLPASAQSFAIATPPRRLIPQRKNRKSSGQDMWIWRTRTTSKQTTPILGCPKIR